MRDKKIAEAFTIFARKLNIDPIIVDVVVADSGVPSAQPSTPVFSTLPPTTTIPCDPILPYLCDNRDEDETIAVPSETIPSPPVTQPDSWDMCEDDYNLPSQLTRPTVSTHEPLSTFPLPSEPIFCSTPPVDSLSLPPTSPLNPFPPSPIKPSTPPLNTSTPVPNPPTVDISRTDTDMIDSQASGNLDHSDLENLVHEYAENEEISRKESDHSEPESSEEEEQTSIASPQLQKPFTSIPSLCPDENSNQVSFIKNRFEFL